MLGKHHVCTPHTINHFTTSPNYPDLYFVTLSFTYSLINFLFLYYLLSLIPNMTKEGNNHQNGWAHGLFDCCTPAGLCLKTTFCPCLTYGKTSHLMDRGNLDDYSCCNGSVSPYHATHWQLKVEPMGTYSIRTRKQKTNNDQQSG